MTLDLDAVLCDSKLHDLFGKACSASATQVWVLEIKRGGSSHVSFLYGRSLPCTSNSEKWAHTSRSEAALEAGCKATVHGLTLHTSGEKLRAFLQNFLQGASLEAASASAAIGLDQRISSSVTEVEFGGISSVRPVMHFPARDFYFYDSKRMSPSSAASADSGAISSADKATIFATAPGLESKVARLVCDALNADTGMKFDELDAWRLGDFELICFPGMSREERSKVDVSLMGTDSSLTLSEPLTHEALDLLVLVSSFSDGGLQAIHTTRIAKEAEYPIEHTFAIDSHQSRDATAYKLEIYTNPSGNERSRLLVQTGSYFVRGVGLNMNIIQPISSNHRVDWLAKQVPKKDAEKLQAACHIMRSVHSNQSEVRAPTNDPWVDQHQLLEDTLHSLLPKPSTGRFFPTLSDSGGLSRLELAEWLRKIFNRHPRAQVAWVDPFMEDVGIDLLNTLGNTSSEYLIITTEKEPQDSTKSEREPEKRMQKLLSSCAGWGRGYYGNVQLRVLTVPSSTLHDRMILIRSPSGVPLAGYHLSNSIQTANLKDPLLATPIPPDVMPNVFELIDEIITRTLHAASGKLPTAKVIFDSKAQASIEDGALNKAMHRATFDEHLRSGDVLAWWLEDDELRGASGESLLAQLQVKGYHKEGKLNPDYFGTIPEKLWLQGFPHADFHSAWDAAGTILANSHAGQFYRNDQVSLPATLVANLLSHLDASRAGALAPPLQKSYLDLEYYRAKTFKELLLSNYDPERDFTRSTTSTSWSDYYALKTLWLHAPHNLIRWLDEQCAAPIGKENRRRALITEALRLISVTLHFEKPVSQIANLLKCKASLPAWLGVHALRGSIIAGTFNVEDLDLFDLLLPIDQQSALGWLIARANDAKSPALAILIGKLASTLPCSLTDLQLQSLLSSLQGRLGRAHHLEPWILKAVLLPLMGSKAIEVSQVTRAWLDDIKSLWESALKDGGIYFTYLGDGAFTDELAVLSVHLDEQHFEELVGELAKVSNKVLRIVHIPLSAEVDWSRYTRAHEVNLWVYTLARRMAALQTGNQCHSLEKLIQDSSMVAARLTEDQLQKTINRDLAQYTMDDPKLIEGHSLRLSVASMTISRYGWQSPNPHP